MSLTCSQMPLSCRYLTSSLVPLERGCVDKYKGFLNKFFQFRDLRSICSVGFEPNPMHNDVLRDLEEKYQTCGWRVNLCHHSVFLYQIIWKGLSSFEMFNSDPRSLLIFRCTSFRPLELGVRTNQMLITCIRRWKNTISQGNVKSAFCQKNHSYVISFLQLWEGEDAGVGLTDPLGISFSNSSFRRRNPIPQVAWGGFWTTAVSMPTTLWRGWWSRSWWWRWWLLWWGS